MSPEPLALPTDPAGWHAFATERADGRLAEARNIVAQLKDGSRRTTVEVLELWNDLQLALASALNPSYLLNETHPDAAVREQAEARVQDTERLSTELSLDRDLYDAIAALPAGGLEPIQVRLLDRILRDFRRAGVDRSEAEREELRTLAERATELGLAFDRNIRDGKRSIRVSPDRLGGLPQDFVEAHPVDDEGLVTLTTEYPDLFPVLTYADDGELRAELSTESSNIAWPENEAVLAELLAVRRDRAAKLGYGSWADYETEVRMIGSGAGIAAFIEQLDPLTAEATARELAQIRDLLGREPKTSDLRWALRVLQERHHDVDQQVVRSYFRFDKVREGLLKTTGRLFDIGYRQVDAPVWHPEVAAYDVVRGDDVLGRIYLDLHPRENKYNHAAQFPFVPGIAGRQLPEGVLVCNFSTGLMEHNEVVTFFHEFGHLMHEILGGRQRYAQFSGVATEWDFVEAPSQMLEEWAWDAEVLASFGTNDAGEPIPADLVSRMRAADSLGRALLERRQLTFNAISYHLHVDPPGDITSQVRALQLKYQAGEPLPGIHPAASFGHLNGYGACYYTYAWSLVIARDLLSAFGGNLLDAAVATRYRTAILEAGGSKDAAELVEDFLGRPYAFDAYRQWLAGS